ncbi:MAG: ATP-binding protein [bacterium]
MLGIGVLLLLVYSVAGYLMFSSEKALLIKQTSEKTEIINRMIVLSLRIFMTANNIRDLHNFYKNLSGIKGIKEIKIIHGEAVEKQFGSVMYDHIYVPDPISIRAIREQRNMQIIERGPDGRNLRNIFVLKCERKCQKCHNARVGEVLGAISVSTSLKDIDRSIQNRHITLFFATFASVFLVIGCLYVLIKFMVLDKLKKLVGFTERVGKGKLDSRADIATGDEIGTLADAFNDMTARLKSAQDGMVTAEKLAAIGRLAANITHEVNNPIGIILSRIDCLQNDLKTGSDANIQQLNEDIGVIKKHAQRISNITEGLLAFSRKSEAEYTAVDVNKVIDDVCFLVRKQFADENIILIKKASLHLYVSGNENELQQVLFNIICNARDAMPDGGRIEIDTSLERAPTSENGKDIIRIKVSDEGEGIPEENLSRIFEPFFSTKEKGKGTGLGLSISYRIISEHGGKIEVESEGGKGTTFTILLPALKQTEI